MAWGSALAAFGGSLANSFASSGTLGAWDGGWSTYSSGQSRTKYALEKAYEMQQRAWAEGPSAIRKGLEKAGVNPLLATSSFGNVSAPSASFSDSPVGGSTVDFSALKGMTAKEQKKIKENEVDQGRANVDRTKAETEAIEASADAKRAEILNLNADTELKSTQQWTQPLSTIGGSALNGALIYKAIKSAGETKGATSAVRGASKVVPLLLPAVGSSAKAINIGSKFLRGLGFFGAGASLAVPVGKQMYKAQKEAMKNGKTSFTNHMSAGW